MIKQLFLNAIIVVVSLLVFFLFGELFIRLLQLGGQVPVFTENSSPYLNVVQKTPTGHYNAQIKHVSNTNLGWELRRKDRNLNSLGFRGYESSLTKPPGTFRIAIVGDSYTYGFSVPLEKTFGMRLQSQLNTRFPEQKFEVLNFGVIGYNTQQELEHYKLNVRQFKPDLVILGYVLNDVFSLDLTLNAFRSIATYRNQLATLSKYTQFGSWIYLQTIPARFQILGFYYTLISYKINGVWEQTLAAIQHLNELTAQNGSRFTVVVFPYFQTFDSTYYPYASIHKQIAADLYDKQISRVDLLGFFDTKNLNAFQISKIDSHPNIDGHEMAANIIFQHLIDAHLINGLTKNEQ